MNKNPTCESALTINYTMEDVRQSILKAYEALRANPANLHQVRCAQQVLGKVTATAAQQLKYHKMTETAPTPALQHFLTGAATKDEPAPKTRKSAKTPPPTKNGRELLEMAVEFNRIVSAFRDYLRRVGEPHAMSIFDALIILHTNMIVKARG